MAGGRPRGLRKAMPEALPGEAPVAGAQAAKAAKREADAAEAIAPARRRARTGAKDEGGGEAAAAGELSLADRAGAPDLGDDAPVMSTPRLTEGYRGLRALPPATLTFLQQLKEHNDRDWFNAHKKEYEAARDSVLELFKGVAQHLERIDTELGPQDPKACMFRIYRDIRFSNDHTPYKTCLSGAMARHGRKSPHACYYIHIEPGKSFIGGGMWMPEAAILRQLREAIAQGAGAEIRQCINRPEFKRHFGATPLFHEHDDRLKTAPKGFAKDHPFVDLLQLKSFTVGRKLSDDLLTSPALLETIVAALAEMMPFNQLLNSLANLT